MTAASHPSALDVLRVRHDTAVEAVAAGLARAERGQLRLARCLSEITTTIAVVDRLLPSGMVVVLTSSQELVAHVAAWWNQAHPDAAYLLTGKTHHVHGVPRNSVFATSPDIIAAWARAETGTLRVLIGQHRHAELIGEGLLKAAGWADLLIVHEAQHTAGHAKRHATVHDDKVLPTAARLYTTAVPRIFRRPDTAPADPDEVALSMDEEDVFGPILHEYPAEQAIVDGVAVRFRLRVIPLPHTSPDHRPSPARHAAAIGTSTAAAGTPRLFCTHRDSRRTIKVTLAEALSPGCTPLSSQDFPCSRDTSDAVTIAITHPDGSNSDVTITVTIKPATGTTDNSWLEVARTHTGLQHILRTLREWDPSFGTALDAARAHGTDHHHGLLRWITVEPPTPAPSGLVDDLLAGLACSGAHDWWVGFGHLAAHHARTGSTVVPIRHEANGYPLGQWQSLTRSTYVREGLPLDRYNALTALGMTTDNQHDMNRQRRWKQHIAAAQAFHARYGHLDVFLPGTEAPTTLRSWLGQVRRGHWPLTDTERAALDALGMVWDPPPLLRRKAVAAVFADYAARHGNLDIPNDLIVDVRGEPTRLLNWVTVFRREHRLGTLHPDVRRTLQNAGFVFDPDAAWWDDLITTARRHHERHGDLDVTPGEVLTAAGTCLLTALQECRARSRRRRFDPARAASLDALDPLWGTARQPTPEPQPARPQPPSPQPAAQAVNRRPVPRPQPVPSASSAWNAGLHAAWRHRDRFGHLLPATDYRDPVTGLNLMQWLSTQRRAHRNGRLTPEQITALDALDMSWDPAATSRRIGIQNARSYQAQHGHLRVPATTPHHGTDARGEPYNLYNALARARRDHATGTLHPEWRQALDDLGYDYAAAPAPLSDCVAELEAYHAEHGNLNIDRQHPAHTSLTRVNRACHRAALPHDLQRRLDAIGYGQKIRSSDWDAVFATVQQFYDEHGHLDIPADLRANQSGGDEGVLVRPWLNYQRRRLRAGTITQQQKEKLDAVGFIWDLEEAEWMEKYRLARSFHQRHGHLAVTKVHVRENNEWAPLPVWLRKQTRLRAAQRLSDQHIQLLDNIGMPWVERPGREHHWQQRLRQVERFHRTHGHTRIYAQLNQTTDTHQRKELKTLAAWLNDQLVYARRGTLRPDRREQLEAIGIKVPTTAQRPNNERADIKTSDTGAEA